MKKIMLAILLVMIVPLALADHGHEEYCSDDFQEIILGVEGVDEFSIDGINYRVELLGIEGEYAIVDVNNGKFIEELKEEDYAYFDLGDDVVENKIWMKVVEENEAVFCLRPGELAWEHEEYEKDEEYYEEKEYEKDYEFDIDGCTDWGLVKELNLGQKEGYVINDVDFGLTLYEVGTNEAVIGINDDEDVLEVGTYEKYYFWNVDVIKVGLMEVDDDEAVVCVDAYFERPNKDYDEYEKDYEEYEPILPWDLGIPIHAREKFEELADIYGDSLGVTFSICRNEEERIYVVSGSGGYTGETYYYSVEGEKIGISTFTDAINPNDPPSEPPVDLDEYDCDLIEEHGDHYDDDLTPIYPDKHEDPVMCTTDYNPVCGKDGKTYSNACNAEVVEVRIACEGECPCVIGGETEGIVHEVDEFLPELYPEEEKCDGCEHEDNCLPYGTRKDGQYCNLESSFVDYKEEGATCDNNYECSTNQCLSGTCGDLGAELEETQGLLKRILGFFSRIFGGE